MPGQDIFHWAAKVSRRDIHRLYQSDADGLLDEDLLNNVMYAINARVRDMFEVRQAQQAGRVTCRQCSTPIPQPYWMGGRNKGNPLACPSCGWQTTCGAFYDSYTGKDLLPGSREDLFVEFLERFPTAHTPQEKMLLLDWLIHAFHVHCGVTGRLVAMNVIQGTHEQLVEMLTSLAAGPEELAASSKKTVKETFLAEEDNPVRRFHKKHPTRAEVLKIAARLGIRGRDKMAVNVLIAEILRLAPELAEKE